MKRRFLIDTDTASDDAVALIMALRHRDVDVRAITVVSGNVPLRRGVRNALYTVELCGADVPVFAGCDRPLLRDREHATWFHGRDGFGDMDYPPPKRRACGGHAVDVMVRTILDTPDMVLVTLGPLTNIAAAILREPRIVKCVKRCVLMGGNPYCEGNVTPAAEYNIWCDPEAARIVFRSGLPIEMVGWQLSRGDATLRMPDIKRICSMKSELARFAIDCNRAAKQGNRRQAGGIGIALPDPVAMAVALDPSIIKDKGEHVVEVETASELTRGMTVVDRLNVSGDARNRGIWSEARRHGTATVICGIDIPRWKQLLYRSLRR